MPNADLHVTHMPALIREGDESTSAVVTSFGPDGVTLLTEGSSHTGASLVIEFSHDPTSEPLVARATAVEVSSPKEGVPDRASAQLTVQLEETPSPLQEWFDAEAVAAERDRRVVVVDDDVLQLHLLSRILPLAGLDPVCVNAPEWALYVVARVRPKLVLLDINMAQLDGRELCRRLKADERTKDAKIIFASGLPRSEIAEATTECGADAFIEKGDDVNSIFGILHRVID